MGRDAVNPVPDLHARSRVLSFSVIEAALNGFSEPQFVGLAYSHTAWALHFVEHRWGVDGIHRLLDAFASGARSEQAVAAALGLTLAELDADFREWARTEAPAVWATEIRRYDQEAEMLAAKAAAEEAPPATVSGRSRFSTREAQAERRQELQRWFDGYQARVQGIRERLQPVIAVYHQGERRDVRPICSELETEISAFLRETRWFDVPVTGVRRDLRDAYEHLWKLSRACAEGRTTEVLPHLETAQKAFVRVDAALAPLGLQP